MKNLIVSSFIIITMALTLTACGVGKTVNQKAGEKIAEKIIETQTGGKVDVNSNGDNVTIKTEDGQTQLSAGGGAKLPDAFPKELIVSNDAKLIMSTSSSNGSSVTYLTNDDKATTAEKYLSDLPGDGWKKDMEVDAGQGKMMNFSKGKESVVIIVGDNDSKDNTEKTVVHVTLVIEKDN